MVAPTADVHGLVEPEATGHGRGHSVGRLSRPPICLSAGRANGKDASGGNRDRNNFAPRVANLHGVRRSIRVCCADFSAELAKPRSRRSWSLLCADGRAIAADTDVNGSFGLADSLVNGAGQFTMQTAPRFSRFMHCDSLLGAPGPEPILRRHQPPLLFQQHRSATSRISASWSTTACGHSTIQ